MQLELTYIRTDGGTQPRSMYHYGTVDSYAEDMEAGAAFPPVVVFYDGSDYWLADGFHRVLAAKKIERATINADIRQGTLQDAQWYSYSVNQTHGLRRSNEDKRRAVEAALAHPKAAGMSDREIAEHCGVSHQTVSNYRIALSKFDSQSTNPIRTGRDGRTINTANIGKSNGKKPTPPSAQQVEAETDDKPLTPYEEQIAAQYVQPDPLAQEVDRLVLRYTYGDLCRLIELLSERVAVNA